MKPQALIVAVALTAPPLSTAAVADAADQAGQTIQVPIPAAGEQQKAEYVLRKTIAAFTASKPNFDDMDTPLADAFKQQSATLQTMLVNWGALTSLEYKGWDPQHDVWAFQAGFEKGQAQCLIGFDPDGKMRTLWFKPITA